MRTLKQGLQKSLSEEAIEEMLKKQEKLLKKKERELRASQQQLAAQMNGDDKEKFKRAAKKVRKLSPEVSITQYKNHLRLNRSLKR